MAKGKKTGGREQGTPNRDRKHLIERLNDMFPGYDPVLAMAAIANDKKLDINLRFQANKEVAKYVSPQLKSIDLAGQGGPTKITVRITPPLNKEEKTGQE